MEDEQANLRELNERLDQRLDDAYDQIARVAVR